MARLYWSLARLMRPWSASGDPYRGVTPPRRGAAPLQDVIEVLVGQLGDDNQLAGDDLDPFGREQERVPDGLDAFEGAEFLLGLDAFTPQGVEVAVDELDGLEQPPRDLALPDL